MKRLTLIQAINRGLRFIEQNQAKDGSFQSLSSPSRTDFSKAQPYHTTFTTSLILGALAQSPGAQARRIRQAASKFLLEQKSEAWSFNYWARSAPEYTRQPYPDDLDDTFCALIGLYHHQPSLIDEAVLAAVTQLLVRTEATVGGPYRTWLVPATSPRVWRDIDVAVNCNVAYFLQVTGIHLPNLDAYLQQQLESQSLSSRYYPSAYPLLYYFSRAYTGKDQLGSELELLATAAETTLEHSLVISSYAHRGMTSAQLLQSHVQYLLEEQQANGSWPAEAFCIDPSRHRKTYYNGCAALTTAFAVEALQNYLTTLTKPKSESQPRARDPYIAQVLSASRKQTANLPIELRHQVQAIVDRLAASSAAAEIIRLPHQLSQSIRVPDHRPAKETITQLSLANLYGWAAYTLYDDFLDEDGHPLQLPAANTCLRYSLEAFRQAMPDHPRFQLLVQQTFNQIDGANTWEVTHCRAESNAGYITLPRLPTFGTLRVLADKSLGHCLTPLALAISLSQPYQPLQRVLVQYLIIRQLNDDLHDWEDDIRHGQLTYVVCHILRGANIKPGRYAIADLLPKLQKQFWHHSLPQLCERMQAELAKANQALNGVTWLKTDNVLAELLVQHQRIIHETLKTQRQAERFLEHYRKAS